MFTDEIVEYRYSRMSDEDVVRDLISGAYFASVKSDVRNFSYPGARYDHERHFRPEYVLNELDFTKDMEWIRKMAYLPVRKEGDAPEYFCIYRSTVRKFERGSYPVGTAYGSPVFADQQGIYLATDAEVYYLDTSDFGVRQIGRKDAGGSSWDILGLRSYGPPSQGYIETTDGGRYLLLNGARTGPAIEGDILSVDFGGVYEVIIVTTAGGTGVYDANTGDRILQTPHKSVWGDVRWLRNRLWIGGDAPVIVSDDKVRQTKFDFYCYNKYDFRGKSADFGIQELLSGAPLFIYGYIPPLEIESEGYTPHSPDFLAGADDIVRVLYVNADRTKFIHRILTYLDEPENNELVMRYRDYSDIPGVKRFIKSHKIGNVIDGVFEYYSYR